MPTADSYVDASKLANKYGSSSNIYVDGDPMMIAYMKFDLAPLAGKTIQNAKLRLRVFNTSAAVHTLKQVIDSSWVESSLAYNNRPPLAGVITTFNNATSGGWIEINITSYVSQKKGQNMSLGIDSTNADAVGFYSKENATDKPQLIVTYQ